MIVKAFILFLSAMIGGVLAIVLRGGLKTYSRLFLSFSGAFLLAIGVLNILPGIYQGGPPHVGVFILLGFLLQLFLEFFSGGVEHGHAQKERSVGKELPVAVLLSLSLHAFLESIPLGGSAMDSDHGFLLGLFLHKIPVSIALMTLLLSGKVKKGTAVLSLLVFALMAPLGIYSGYYFPHWVMANSLTFHHYTLAIVVGVLLHVSTTILFESSEDHHFNRYKTFTVITGFLLAYLIH